MDEHNREVIAHLARSLRRYIPEAEREARQLGYSVPVELAALSIFLADCARTRQGTTSEVGEKALGNDVDMAESLLLTKREAAADLRISVRQLERLIQANDLLAVKLNGATRIRRMDLRSYVAGLDLAKQIRRCGS